jgi:exopolysaccharide biosynthesis protein
MNILIIVGWLLLLNCSAIQAHTYECRKGDQHVIHIITFQPQHYTVNYIKARDQVWGRETIEDIAKRTGADIAINGGFFEIGHTQDGMPSGTLIVNQKNFKIEEVLPRLEIKIGKNTFTPQKVNKLCKNGDVILYSQTWGARTFTPLKERQEIAIDQDNKVVEVSKHGNILIPQKGFVLSLPIKFSHGPVAVGDGVKIHLEPFDLSKSTGYSAVMGIPSLLQDGNINPLLEDNKQDFYKSPHSRTALGIRKDGTVVIVVAEHVYKKPLKEVTLEEVKSVIGNNKAKIMWKYKKTSLSDLTMTEMKEIVAKEFRGEGTAVGLSLLELATLLKNLGCESAINLDGGGSSSLYANNRVINHIVGDKDEGMGREISRPLSDAIVFKQIS